MPRYQSTDKRIPMALIPLLKDLNDSVRNSARLALLYFGITSKDTLRHFLVSINCIKDDTAIPGMRLGQETTLDRLEELVALNKILQQSNTSCRIIDWLERVSPKATKSPRQDSFLETLATPGDEKLHGRLRPKTSPAVFTIRQGLNRGLI